MKPHSAASERNRAPILEVLKQWFMAPGTVLEIGAGTGQHAVYFSEHMPHLQWVATDREENHAGIAAWIEEAALQNLRGPLPLDVAEDRWPLDEADYAYSANTAHIMTWPEVELMMAGIGRMLRPRGLFALYGPFNRGGRYTSDSNRAFDESLMARDPNMGIRDDRAMIALAKRYALSFEADHSMPARNRILVWRKDA